jgi:hypothetical protein
MAHHHHDYVDEVRDPADYTGADAQYFETPPGAGYEHTDASVWTIVKFGLWLAVSVVVIHFGLGFMYGLLIRESREVDQPRYPLAANREAPLAAPPRLQQFPRTDMYEFRTKEDAELNGYGWIDKNAGITHIPIDDAMKIVVQRGLPARELDPSQPVETPGLFGSDSSSGRVMERRRQ